MAKKRVTRNGLMENTKAELIEMGKKLKLKGLHALRKSEIVDKILKTGEPVATIQTKVKNSKKRSSKTTKIISETNKNLVGHSFHSISSGESTADFHRTDIQGPLVEDIYIPRNYNETKIVAMIKDPEWIFSYWEVNSELKNHLNLDQYQLILRIYDVTGVDFTGENEHSFFDLPTESYAESWYIKVPESNKNYCIDLGYFDSEGIFKLLARSNTVSVPRNSVSDVYDEHWMTVEELFRLSGGYSGGLQQSGSFEIEQMLAERLKMAVSSEVLISSWSLPSSFDMPSSYQD